jgi:hypothetical protein
VLGENIIGEGFLGAEAESTGAAMAESANFTTVPPLDTTIEDANGAIWSLRLSDRAVLKDGVPTSIVKVMEIWYISHAVYAFKGTHWRKWSGTKWQAVSWETMLGTFQLLPADGTMTETAPLMSTTSGLRTTAGPVTLTSHSGVAISAGANIQTTVDANPAGTTYVLAVGTYTGQTVTPKNGDRFIGLHNGTSGVVMNGSGTAGAAFYGSAAYVVIQNIKMTNYLPGLQHGTIEVIGPYLIVQNCEASDVPTGGGAGIYCADYALVFASKFNNNGQQGYCCHGDIIGPYIDLMGICFDSNEFGANNPSDTQQSGSEQGGGKALFTHRASFWYNYSHNNGGSNFWTDANNSDTVYFANNVGPGGWNGIEHEISYNCVIKYNTFTNVWAYGTPGTGFFSEAAIFFGNVGGITEGPWAGICDISHNTITTSTYGRAIAMRLQDRTRINNVLHGRFGAPRLTRRMYVHHNTINYSASTPSIGGQVGILSDVGSDLIYWGTDRCQFDYNAYTAGSNYNPFCWDNVTNNNFTSWQAFGNDIHGSESHTLQPKEWSTAEKNSNVTISGSGLIATETSAVAVNHTGRGWADQLAINSGDKKMWVVTNTIFGGAAGVCNSSFTFTDGAFLGQDTKSICYFDNGQIWFNFAAIATQTSYTTGDKLVICCHGGNKIWFGKNAVPTVTSGGYDISGMGVVYPAYNLNASAKITAEFQTTTGFTPPTGYTDFTP